MTKALMVLNILLSLSPVVEDFGQKRKPGTYPIAKFLLTDC